MSEKKKKVKAINVLGTSNISFKEPLKDVHTADQPISGCAWIDTNDGVVLIDTMLTAAAGRKVFEKISGKIKYIIYTHGHMDHVGGAKAFIADNPEIIASTFLPYRLDRYIAQAPYRSRIAAQQFNIPENLRMVDFVYPTKTFLGEMTISLGDKTFEMYTARAETDDACWVYVPELNAAFIGDILIGSFPNIGNPWKPTRYSLEWAKALEEIRAKEPEYVFYGGAGRMHKGKKALKALDANIEVIHSMYNQVVDYINQDMHITDMIHQVKIPKHLENSIYLRQAYSRVEFLVFNIYRWLHGYFDGNPANLLPRPEKEVMKEIFGLIGDSNKILRRVRDLLDQNQAQLAIQILDVLIQTEPENIEARKLHIELLQNLGTNDNCLMSRNSWYYFINQDKKIIRFLRKG